MLLETKNIKKNEFIIYSRNSTDENYNYRIVFKNDPELYHRRISFDHIKQLISEYFPKNIIAYRILTNYPDVFLSDSNYSCVILVNGEPELIFTDPVYAVKTIEEYLELNPDDQFRFKIQKVGYSILRKAKNLANYKEEFLFDLNIDQTINQNDQKYIDSIFIDDNQAKYIEKTVNGVIRNTVFSPEEIKDEVSKLVNKSSNSSNNDKEKRTNRLAEGEMEYGVKKLHLGHIQDLRDKNKVNYKIIENVNMLKRLNSSTQMEIRNEQLNFRQQKTVEGKLHDEKLRNDIRVSVTEDEKLLTSGFKKIVSYAPIKLHKVEFEDNGMEKSIAENIPKSRSDDLFKKFLKDLQDEGKLKIKKQNKLKRKGRESDIIQLFKSANREKGGD